MPHAGGDDAEREENQRGAEESPAAPAWPGSVLEDSLWSGWCALPVGHPGLLYHRFEPLRHTQCGEGSAMKLRRAEYPD